MGFKVGDRVRVIGDTGSLTPKDEIGKETVITSTNAGRVYKYILEGSQTYFNESELELIASSQYNQPLGDITTKIYVDNY